MKRIGTQGRVVGESCCEEIMRQKEGAPVDTRQEGLGKAVSDAVLGIVPQNQASPQPIRIPHISGSGAGSRVRAQHGTP